jgi:hypothetical protein
MLRVKNLLLQLALHPLLYNTYVPSFAILCVLRQVLLLLRELKPWPLTTSEMILIYVTRFLSRVVVPFVLLHYRVAVRLRRRLRHLLRLPRWLRGFPSWPPLRRRLGLPLLLMKFLFGSVCAVAYTRAATLTCSRAVVTPRSSR